MTELDTEAARARLGCLYIEAGLGPLQAVRDIVRTRKMLDPVLESQAARYGSCSRCSLVQTPPSSSANATAGEQDRWATVTS